MSELSLSVGPREGRGKNASRRLRAGGKIPAVVYGGDADPVAIELDRKEFVTTMRSGGGENAVFLLKVPGTKTQRHTMIRELQVDPIKHRIVHVDFQRIDLSEKVRVKVTVEIEGTPEGVKTQGGMIDFVTREVEVECLPTQIPESLVVEVSELEIGDTAEASALELPDGVELLEDLDRVLLSVMMPKVVEEDEEDEEEDELLEGELEEPEVLSGAKEEDEEEDES